MPPDIQGGEVWLVGAGPGHIDLLTLKAARLIAAADIIFYDALVGADILSLANAGTDLINVGKRSGRHSMPQAAICDCLVEAAQAGLKVVRLKGGDPGIFGRATEEITALRRHNIPVHIVPGITTACAAAASAGISLTRRGDIRRVQMITAHVRADETLDIDWQTLADPHSVIAIYMGKAAARAIAEGLISAGLPATHPVIAIENVSLPVETSIISQLATLAKDILAAEFTGPVLLLVGATIESEISTSLNFEPDHQATSPIT
jgi:uroporphyrin-III C-methyltransferase